MKALTSIVILCGLAMTTAAQDNTVKLVSEKFETFHQIMQPIRGEAYSNKDYPALFASGPMFEGAFAQIMTIDPIIRNQARNTHYLALRKELGHRVAEYAVACRMRSEKQAYEILPKLHTIFKETMSQLQPLKFSILDDMIVTADAILDKQIPAANWDELKESTQALLMNLTQIEDSSYVVEIEPYRDKMKAEFANGSLIAREMVFCADKKDLATLKAKAIALKGMLLAIRENYL